MSAHNVFCAGVFFALASFLEARAQNAAVSGFYDISSGEYIECCGIAGETRTPLPNSAQRVVKLNIDPQAHTASMTILGDDMRTVFSIIPVCPPSEPPIFFSFDLGLTFADHFVFQVDPSPRGLYWNYTLSNSPSRISLSGLVGLAQTGCADAPSKFTHTNVVAYLVAPPRLELRSYTVDGPLLVVQGREGWQTVVEVSSDLNTWVEISREVMPATRCATCPELTVRDTAPGGITTRF